MSFEFLARGDEGLTEGWKKSCDSDDDNSNYEDNSDSNSHNDDDGNVDNNGDDCNHNYDNGIVEKIMILTVTIMIAVSQDFSTPSRCTYVCTSSEVPCKNCSKTCDWKALTSSNSPDKSLNRCVRGGERVSE